LLTPRAPDPDRIDDPAFVVRPEYIDFNGHMNVAYYSVLTDAACDNLRERLGLGAHTLAEAGLDWFTRQTHMAYRRELMQGDQVSFAVQPLDHDARRLHFMLNVLHAGEGWVAATCEVVAGCVRRGTHIEAEWPEPVRPALARWMAAHGQARPAEAGRVVGVRGALDPATMGLGTAGSDAAPEVDMDALLRNADVSDLVVGAEHTDAGGRIRPGYYTVLCGRAMRHIAAPVFGIGARNVQRTGQTGFVAESRITQVRALRLGDALKVDFKVAAMSDKALHLMISLRHAREGWLAAVHEQVTLCMDAATRRPAAYHPSVRARLEHALRAHRGLPDPVPTGRPLGIGA
jgi:acyl-CoA thioester hydrolase